MALPRFPGAALTSLTITPFLSSTPLDAYLKGASALFLVLGADPSAVAGWYTQRLAHLGYSPVGGAGTNVDASQPISETATTQYFARPGEEFRNGVDTQVEAAGTQGTLLLLEAHVVAPPPRPRASLVPPDLASLVVAFGSSPDDASTRKWAAQTGSPYYHPWRRTLRDGIALMRFARIINALPVLTGISNSAQDPYWASLTFRTRAGRLLVFTLDAAFASVRGPGVTLEDQQGALWDAILTLAPPP